MKKSKIIKGINSYIDYFRLNKNNAIDSIKIVSYSDFLQVHLPPHADLKWSIHSFHKNVG